MVISNRNDHAGISIAAHSTWMSRQRRMIIKHASIGLRFGSLTWPHSTSGVLPPPLCSAARANPLKQSWP